MYNFLYEYNGSKTSLIYHIPQNEQINHSILGTLKDNRIHGLSPVNVNETKEGKDFVYDVSGKLILERYFSATLTKEEFIGTLLGIINPIQEASKYMVRIENIILDAKNIFVDSTTHLVSLICLPLTRNLESQDLSRFFKSIIVNASFNSQEDIGYVAKIINFLNSNAVLSINQFKILIEELSDNNQGEQLTYKKEQKKAGIFHWFKRNNKKEGHNEKFNHRTFPTLQQHTSSNKQLSVTGRLQGSVLRIEPMINGKVVLDRTINNKPYLVRGKNRERISIATPEFRIGSDQKSVDYIIGDNTTISRNHAMILSYENKYFIIDNNSTNRTYLDGKLIPYHHEVEIFNGSKITLSNEDFYFQY